MSERRDIDFILRQWPFKPGVIDARLVCAGDGREVLQMRIEMGVLQMEVSGRPDGEHPGGADTCLDWLRELARVVNIPSQKMASTGPVNVWITLLPISTIVPIRSN